jgi:hypothetical protein
MIPYVPVRTPTPEDPDQLYAAAVRVFLRRGWGLQSRDEKARAVETVYVRTGEIKVGVGFLEESYRVIISNGAVEMFTSCRYYNPTFNKSTECGDERREGVALYEREVIADVFKELKTLAPNTDTGAPGASATTRTDSSSCVSVCGKDRKSCMDSCGNSEKCKNRCMDGYDLCAKACTK